MPRARYRPRPWKLRWTDRNGERKTQAYRHQLGAEVRRQFLVANRYADVALTFETPPKERPR